MLHPVGSMVDGVRLLPAPHALLLAATDLWDGEIDDRYGFISLALCDAHMLAAKTETPFEKCD